MPTIWLDRTTGVSHFKIAKWLSAYLRWYRFSFGPSLALTNLHIVANFRRKEKMTTVLVSGSAGFIGGYVVEELLQRGYEVIGVDNFSKYGPVKKSYDDHPSYRFVEADCRDTVLMEELLWERTISSPVRR